MCTTQCTRQLLQLQWVWITRALHARIKRFNLVIGYNRHEQHEYERVTMHRLAVLSDIHGNFAALQAVADHIDQWKPDAVVVAGDIVNRGPRSRDCLTFVLERAARAGWQIIRGNHEEYVLSIALDP